MRGVFELRQAVVLGLVQNCDYIGPNVISARTQNDGISRLLWGFPWGCDLRAKTKKSPVRSLVLFF